jgi:predicted CoA-binding protein
MTTPDLDAIERFLACRHLAVVGASDAKDNFGRTVFTALRDHGHQVVPINRAGGTVDGSPAFTAIGQVPWQIDGVVVMVDRQSAMGVISEAAAAGVQHVWLFKGLGAPGASSAEALASCAHYGMDVVDGACPLMFLEPVGIVHRIHRRIRQARGQLPTPAA